ncbi:contractile injection system protein, VgrG/Pvc8 family, partial [Clostridium sp. DJ247]|uniref:contractile injection system protein, VgrG/Pvc8 family n=1 Tax=Clostridium sp. DJ247 TaxID=2726188 RepID=UPI0028BD59E4
MEGNNTITYGNISLVCPYEIQSMIELKIIKEVNNHSKLYFTGIIPEEKKDEYISIATSKDKIEVNLLSNGSVVRALFKGLVSNIKVKAVNNIYYLEVEGVSCTYDLDVKLKCRSFQNKNMSYTELIEKVLSSYAGADYMNLAAEGKNLGRFVLQYNETDWQFLKRIASYNGYV